MTENKRPAPEEVARPIRNGTIETDKIQSDFLAKLAPFRAAGWTLTPAGSLTAAEAELNECFDGYDVQARPSGDGFELRFWGTSYSFICSDADEAIAYVGAVKQALEEYGTNPSLFLALPPYDPNRMRSIPRYGRWKAGKRRGG